MATRSSISRTSGLAGAAVLAALLILPGCVNDNNASKPDNQSLANESITKAQEAAAKAQEYAAADRPIEAIDQYRRALALYRDFPAAWNNLGLLLLDQNRAMEAAEAFKSAAELSPSDPRPVKNIGDVWQKQLYFDEAFRRYEQALERDPNYLPALREAIRVDALRDSRNEATAARIQRAIAQETDPAWREYLLRQKVLCDRNVRERNTPRFPDRAPTRPPEKVD